MGKKFNLDNIQKAKDRAQKTAFELKLVPKRQQVRCEEIEFHPNNKFAQNDDEQSIKELADDITANGLISPLAVNYRNGKYRLLSGERRFKAILLMKKDVVDCNVYDNLDDATELRILYAANLEVRKYSNAEILGYYKELSNVLKKQYESGKYNGNINDEIAHIMKISDRQVRKYALICDELNDKEQQQIAEKKLSINAANKIAAERAERKVAELVPENQNDAKTAELVPENQNDAKTAELVPGNRNNGKTAELVPENRNYAKTAELVPKISVKENSATYNVVFDKKEVKVYNSDKIVYELDLNTLASKIVKDYLDKENQ